MEQRAYQDNLNLRNINDSYNFFIDSIISAAKHAGAIIPDDRSHKPRRTNHCNTLWWDKDCKNILSFRREAMKKYLADSNDENLNEYYAIAKKASQTLKSKRTKNYIDFCNKMNPHQKLGDIWNGLKCFKNKNLNGFQPSTPNNLHNHNKEALRTLRNICLPQFRKTDFNIQYNRDSSPVRNDPISIIEVRQAIDLAKSGSSSGRDLNSYDLLKELPPRI